MLDETIFAQLNVAVDNVPLDTFNLTSLRSQLVASTTQYTPTNETETSTASTPARRHANSGRPYVKAVDMELAEDQISIVPFMRSNKITIGSKLDRQAQQMKARNLVTMQLRRAENGSESTNQAHVNQAHVNQAHHVGRATDSRVRTLIQAKTENVFRKKHTSLVSWLGRPWALTILTLGIVGALATLYTFTFLLMKACEGALGRTNQGLALFHLFAVIMLLVAAVL